MVGERPLIVLPCSLWPLPRRDDRRALLRHPSAYDYAGAWEALPSEKARHERRKRTIWILCSAEMGEIS